MTRLTGSLAPLLLAVGLVASCSGGSVVVTDAGATDGTAACGAYGLACCDGTACNAGLTCAGGTCSIMVTDAAGGGSSSSGGSSGASSGSSGGSTSGGPDDSGGGTCKSGSYVGTATGWYASHLTLIGVLTPVSSTVSLTLVQAGAVGTTCTLGGESVDCSDVFIIQDGSFSGLLDADDAGGSLPFLCSLTGALDCSTRTLVGGWIMCTYCEARGGDGGLPCGPGTTGGSGTPFAGELTADYDTTTSAFVNAAWNASEALGGNDGGSPGPDGGPALDYLALDGGYGGNDYGGKGAWSAAYP